MLSSHADDFRNELWQMFLQHRGVGAGTVDERKFGLLGCVRLLLTRLLLFTSAHSLLTWLFSFPAAYSLWRSGDLFRGVGSPQAVR